MDKQDMIPKLKPKLKELYKLFNEKLFNDELPKNIPIVIHKREVNKKGNFVRGRTYFISYLHMVTKISIVEEVGALGPQVLLHEMIHVWEITKIEPNYLILDIMFNIRKPHSNHFIRKSLEVQDRLGNVPGILGYGLDLNDNRTKTWTKIVGSKFLKWITLPVY